MPLDEETHAALFRASCPIRQLRQEHYESIPTLAAALGVHERAVEQWEKNQNGAKMENIRRVAVRYSANPLELYHRLIVWRMGDPARRPAAQPEIGSPGVE